MIADDVTFLLIVFLSSRAILKLIFRSGLFCGIEGWSESILRQIIHPRPALEEAAPKWWKAQSTLTWGFCYSAPNPPRKASKEIKILSVPTLTDVYFPCGFCTLIFCCCWIEIDESLFLASVLNFHPTDSSSVLRWCERKATGKCWTKAQTTKKLYMLLNVTENHFLFCCKEAFVMAALMEELSTIYRLPADKLQKLHARGWFRFMSKIWMANGPLLIPIRWLEMRFMCIYLWILQPFCNIFVFISSSISWGDFTAPDKSRNRRRLSVP